MKRGKFMQSKIEKVKEFAQKHATKAYVGLASATLMFTPKPAFADAPSAYVNKIADGLFGEILKVAPKVALVVIALSVLMYLISADEHKKNKHRSVGVVALLVYCILLVIKPLVTWFSGLV